MNIIHFNTGPTPEYSRVPLCHATAQNGTGWSRGYYTYKAADVTCRRCLISMGITLPPKLPTGPLEATCTLEEYPF